VPLIARAGEHNVANPCPAGPLFALPVRRGNENSDAVPSRPRARHAGCGAFPPFGAFAGFPARAPLAGFALRLGGSGTSIDVRRRYSA